MRLAGATEDMRKPYRMLVDYSQEKIMPLGTYLAATALSNSAYLEAASGDICRESRLCDRSTHEINFVDANVPGTES